MASSLLRRSLAVIAVVALTTPAAAQPQQPSAADKETARALMDKGDEKMDAKDYAAALKAYLAADAIMRLPMTGVAVAKAQAAAGLLVEARDTAMTVARSPVVPGETPPYARARAEAADLAARLVPRIPSIVVVVANAPAGASISVDGAVIPPAAAGAPRKVNPGAHVVAVTAPGFQAARAEVNVREGEEKLVPITLEAAAAAPPVTPPPVGAPPVTTPPPASRSISPLVGVGFGIGGAGLLAGAITGALSLAKTSSIKGACDDKGGCPSDQRDALASANLLANVSNVTIGVGLAGVALGVVGVVLSKPREAKPAAARIEIEPLLGPGTIGVRGAF